MVFYSRRLPHWQPSGKPLFVTWHLRGSLPHNRFPPPSGLSAGKAFVWMDRFLDEARYGPTWLLREPVAQVTANSLHYAAETLGYFDLHAYVVMANHVHLLATPKVPPTKFLQSVKGYSAREANKLLGRTGEPFWQSESYDHWVRDGAEFQRVSAYIENNPVRAGLAAEPRAYRWSSAYDGSKAVVAG
jgi:REP element-mobilizing transposase RayT